MRSDVMKSGPEKGPHRSLWLATGLARKDLDKPIIGIANSYNEIIPGHVDLNKISAAVKRGILMAGGTPVEFGTIGVCDGIAMNHLGMRYSLVSREVIADSLEIMAQGHPFDGIVLVSNCDKITPGMIMAALAEHPVHSDHRRADAGGIRSGAFPRQVSGNGGCDD